MWLVSLEDASLIEVTNYGSFSRISPSHHAKSWVSSGLVLFIFFLLGLDKSNLKKKGLILSPSLEV